MADHFLSISHSFPIRVLFISHSFLFISHSFPVLFSSCHFQSFSKQVTRKWNEVNEEEKKANAANDPIQNIQHIYQYKTQYIIPNTFTNKESIAHKDSLQKQLKQFNHFPSPVWGRGGYESLLDIIMFIYFYRLCFYCYCFFNVCRLHFCVHIQYTQIYIYIYLYL